MVDPNILGLNKLETINFLQAHSPDVLILEPSAVDSEEVFEIITFFKKNYKTLSIVVGAYAQAEPELCQKDADFVVPGEYETTVLEIIRSGVKKSDCITIPGLYPTPRESLIDPNDLPWPEDNDISRLDYTEPGCDYRMIQLYASRGCALACSFCVAPTYYGNRSRTWRPRAPKDVVKEIKYLSQKYNGYFKGIFFNEEAHNTSKEWVADLCNEIIKNKLNYLKYDAMCMYYNFNDELFKLMQKAGYYQIRFGIETFNQETGKKIKKNVKFEKLKSMLQKAKEYGFITFGTSIVGGQNSTFEEDLRTHNLLCSLRDDLKLLDKWQTSIATPQPGTPFYDWVKTHNFLISDDLSRYNGRQTVCKYHNYSAEEIELMYQISKTQGPISLIESRALLSSRVR